MDDQQIEKLVFAIQGVSERLEWLVGAIERLYEKKGRGDL